MLKTIAVLGAGHGGCAAAADLSRRGFSVRLHARSAARLAPLRAIGGLDVRGVHEGRVAVAVLTDDLGEAVRGADLIMLVVPSVAHAEYARALIPLLDPAVPVFLNPGHTGGGLHFVHALREAGYDAALRCCETVTLTYITRMEGPATVNIYSYTRKLAFAAFPGKDVDELYALLQPLYPELVPASNVLETALTNINAVFHPPGMLMNAGWIERTGGGFRFYAEGITASVGRVAELVDRERLAIAQALGIPARTFVASFLRAGLTTEAAAASGSIARACEESAPNRTIAAPPRLDHRYIHEDVGYGLVPWSALGSLAGVATPTIDALITLASAALGVDVRRTGLGLEGMGLAGRAPADLPAFLHEGDR